MRERAKRRRSSENENEKGKGMGNQTTFQTEVPLARIRIIPRLTRHRTQLKHIANANTYISLLRDRKVNADLLKWVERLRDPLQIKLPL